LGSERPELKTSASSQEATITAKARERRKSRDTSLPSVKTASYFRLDGRELGPQRERD